MIDKADAQRSHKSVKGRSLHDVDTFLKFFAASEKGQLFGIHLDRFSGFGISTDIGFILLDEDTAETTNLYPLAFG